MGYGLAGETTSYHNESMLMSGPVQDRLGQVIGGRVVIGRDPVPSR